MAVAFVRPSDMFCAVFESLNMSLMTSTRWSVALIAMLCSAKNPASLTSAVFTAVSSFSFSDVLCKHCVVDFCAGARFFSFSVCFFDLLWFFNIDTSATRSVLQHRQKALLSEPATGLNHTNFGSFVGGAALSYKIVVQIR
ncbi:hypothetical protein CHARACLAT_021970 [Characodon lateralis]|uniref:Secreted protein n=1 Tax=Characodon lateralis TaxID=208331 RepID=A0ABU7DBN2_9TELE|nr:hypothetical protein [Characodon lateralis]